MHCKLLVNAIAVLLDIKFEESHVVVADKRVHGLKRHIGDADAAQDGQVLQVPVLPQRLCKQNHSVVCYEDVLGKDQLLEGGVLPYEGAYHLHLIVREGHGSEVHYFEVLAPDEFESRLQELCALVLHN